MSQNIIFSSNVGDLVKMEYFMGKTVLEALLDGIEVLILPVALGFFLIFAFVVLLLVSEGLQNWYERNKEKVNMVIKLVGWLIVGLLLIVLIGYTSS